MQGAQAKQRTRTMKEFNIDEMTTFEMLDQHQRRLNRRNTTITKAVDALTKERTDNRAALAKVAEKLPKFEEEHKAAIKAQQLKVLAQSEALHKAQIKLRQKLEKLGLDPDLPYLSQAENEQAETVKNAGNSAASSEQISKVSNG